MSLFRLQAFLHSSDLNEHEIQESGVGHEEKHALKSSLHFLTQSPLHAAVEWYPITMTTRKMTDISTLFI